MKALTATKQRGNQQSQPSLVLTLTQYWLRRSTVPVIYVRSTVQLRL